MAGIIATTTNTANIQNNTVGSIDASGTSATTAGGLLGIQTTGSAGVVTTSNNTIGSATLQNIRIGYMTTTGVAGGPLSNAGILTSTTTATAGTLIGITNAATGAPLNITANTLRNLASSVSHTGSVNSFFGIINQGAVPGTVNITNNNLGTATERCATYTGPTTGQIVRDPQHHRCSRDDSESQQQYRAGLCPGCVWSGNRREPPRCVDWSRD